MNMDPRGAGKELLLGQGRIAVHASRLDPGRETLVFIHGLAGSASAWNPLLELDWGRWNRVRIDLRGHGLSCRYGEPADYRIEQMASDVVRVVDELGLDRPTLIAHSFGCLVALACAASAPSRVGRLILLSPGFPRHRPRWSAALGWLLKIGAPRARGESRPGHRLDYRRYPRNTDYDPRRLAADIRNTGLWVYLACIRWAMAVDMPKLLAQVDRPGLLVHGTRDAVFALRDAERLHSHLHHSVLVTIREAGHVLPLTHAERLHSIVLDHLKAAHAGSGF